MSAKRALIVDDSRSARAFLSRILERYQLQVDNAASAEEALDYLTRSCPDVIFMDHLMPGMDGFQALTAIKNDPRTATIPIMMYTSQEGELYLSQARALGALGVLPKQIKPADVSRALEQLHLLGELPTPGTGDTAQHSVLTAEVPALAARAQAAASYAAPTIGPAAAAAAATSASGGAGAGLSAEARSLIEAMLQEHTREMRRVMSLSLEKHSARVVAELRALLAAQGQVLAPGAPADVNDSGVTRGTVETDAARAGRAHSSRAVLWLSAAAALVALLAGALWLGSWWLSMRTDAAAPASAAGGVNANRAALPAGANPAAPMAAPIAGREPGAVALSNEPASPTGAAASYVDPVPFGESPLAGARTEHLQAALEKLLAAGFHGQVEIRSFPGRYCLQGTGDAVVLASAEINYARCDQIGNPLDPSGPAAHESVAFANMLAALRTRAAGAIEVQVGAGNADELSVPYPAVTEQLSAGEWNRAAAANNRVEMRWHATP
jgi:CheY-like chemotaxis protein